MAYRELTQEEIDLIESREDELSEEDITDAYLQYKYGITMDDINDMFKQAETKITMKGKDEVEIIVKSL